MMLDLVSAGIIYAGHSCLESVDQSLAEIRMPLQFPNARLFIHDLLIGGQSGPAAIARSANQYGLIPIESVEEVAAGSNGCCGCMATAKNVLLKCFKSEADQSNSYIVDVDQIWSEMESMIERHRKGESTAKSASVCLEHDSGVPNNNECTKLAPVVFDYLLQQINRYS